VLYVQATAQLDPQSTVSGWTRAFDAATGAEKWAMAMPGAMTGAVTTTGGGVVMTGGADGDFRVLDQASGKLLYRFATGGEIQGGISTYEVEGKQYVAVASGGAGLVPFGPVGAPTLLVFALKP
jgi:alcohol dehydrogenase (cytochrome c)